MKQNTKSTKFFLIPATGRLSSAEQAINTKKPLATKPKSLLYVIKSMIISRYCFQILNNWLGLLLLHGDLWYWEPLTQDGMKIILALKDSNANTMGIHYEDGFLIIILQAMQTVVIHYGDGSLIIILQAIQSGNTL